MDKLLSCGLIVAVLVLGTSFQVCAESPIGEPVFARANSAANMTEMRQLIKDNPKIIDRIKTLISQNPQLVASISKKISADSSKLIQEIQNYPQLAESIIDANPHLILALIDDPQFKAILLQ
jgi:hypothetical protein